MKSFVPTHASGGLFQNTVNGWKRNPGMDIRGGLTRKQLAHQMGRDNWLSGTASMS